eukprot:TRINITY_DN115401_c0_g1_i1.p1 TRINITY_DN115401_c0_g1~~TRINITY_DN115401_c0_g1_i1.p1  ORF type:complete len:317 (-),score=78.21 TRINITY_DN115401_c0_g1_i1:122-982(-)
MAMPGAAQLPVQTQPSVSLHGHDRSLVDFRRIAAGVHEDMMVAMLSTLQAAATACAEICVERLRTLHEDILVSIEEKHDAAQLEAKLSHGDVMREALRRTQELELDRRQALLRAQELEAEAKLWAAAADPSPAQCSTVAPRTVRSFSMCDGSDEEEELAEKASLSAASEPSPVKGSGSIPGKVQSIFSMWQDAEGDEAHGSPAISPIREEETEGAPTAPASCSSMSPASPDGDMYEDLIDKLLGRGGSMAAASGYQLGEASAPAPLLTSRRVDRHVDVPVLNAEAK